MDYKTTYTKADIEELEKWFATHTYEKELDLGGGLYIKDLDFTIPPLMHAARTQYDNKTFSGQIHQLYRIRRALIEQNKVTGEK
jgi:hypothetical protein